MEVTFFFVRGMLLYPEQTLNKKVGDYSEKSKKKKQILEYGSTSIFSLMKMDNLKFAAPS